MAQDDIRPMSSPLPAPPRRRRKSSFSSNSTVFGRFGKWLLAALVHRRDVHHQPVQQLPQLLQPGRHAAGEVPLAGQVRHEEDRDHRRQRRDHGRRRQLRQEADRPRARRPRRRRRRGARQLARRHRHRQRLHLSPPARAGRQDESCRSSSAWAASAPAAATTSRWPSATNRTRSSPSPRPGPARSA